jgi:hypothetical protein
MAEDAVTADPKHYTVESEDDVVRVLRIRYGPGEKSVIHGHPRALGVNLTDVHARFTLPDGNTEEIRQEAGEVQWYPAGDHLPENLSDQPVEMILVELKV